MDKFSKRTFLTCGNDGITYGNLFQECEKKLHFLKKGQLILIVADNTISFFQIYFYALKKGVPQILIDRNTSANNIKKIIKIYKPNCIFLKKENLPKNNFSIFTNFKDYQICNYSKKRININKNLAILLSTSGSTGSSKFVKLSYENIFSNAINIAKYLKIKNSHTTITTMLPSYSYGLSIINSHFISGAKIIINNDTFFSKEFWTKLNFFKVNSFGGVPFQYQILKKLKFDKFDLKYIKYLTQAGGSLNKEDLKYFLTVCKKKKIDFIQMYGQTEASPRISYLPFFKAANKIGSIGKAIPGGRMYLKKKKKEKIGEIIYKGKNVFMGYSLSFKDLNNRIKKNRVLNTGDFAWKDDQGYYYIIGRKDKFVKLAGLRVNLEEIKSQLKDENISIELLQKNNKVCIFTKFGTSEKKILETIFLRFKLNRSFFKVYKIQDFPKNIRNKIDYKQLIKYATN